MMKAMGWQDDDQAVYVLVLSVEEAAALLAGNTLIVDTADGPPAGFGVPGGPKVMVGVEADPDRFVEKLRSMGVEANPFPQEGSGGG